MCACVDLFLPTSVGGLLVSGSETNEQSDWKCSPTSHSGHKNFSNGFSTNTTTVALLFTLSGFKVLHVVFSAN